MNLSSRHVRAFLALSQHQHFTRAAAECNISQPAFSVLIRSLEEMVGLKLFERSTRQVLLTNEGKRFLISAQRLAQEFDACELAMRNTANLLQGRVCIAALPSLMAGWLPQVLKEFLSLYPDVSVRVLDCHSSSCLSALAQGEADLALTALAGDVARFHSQALFSDGFSLVCPREHPLALLPEITASDLRAWPCIRLPRDSQDGHAMDVALLSQTQQPWIEAECLTSAIGLVQVGLGICVLPTLSLSHFRDDTLLFRPLPHALLARSIYLVMPHNRVLPPPAQALCTLIETMQPQRGTRAEIATAHA